MVPDLGGLKVLRGVEDIAAYLANAANLPLFGKPRGDSFARGAAAITGPGASGHVRFLSGEEVPIRALAEEIARDWAGGYLFQPFYRLEPGLAAHVGAAMASVRIVTLATAEGIEPWYAVIRLPARAAMHDGDAKGERIWGLIDLADGRVSRLRSLRDPEAGDLNHGNNPDLPFLGFQMPFWTEAMALVKAGHAAFPGHGVIGWDVFLTEDGAILNEANNNPGHLYQVAAQKPLFNAEMRPLYARALAFARQHGGGAIAF